ncbi:MAG: hypothetical protein AAGE59_38585 [Cyanobacteria bacterium P01_F01_bin.86]
MRIVRKVFSVTIFGIPVMGTAVGSFLLLSTMFIWYGGLFVHTFQPLMGITEEQVDAESLGIWYPMGFLFCAVQGIGIATILKWREWPNILEAGRTGAIVALLLGAMVFTYPLVILPEHSIVLFLINASGLVVAWTLAAVAISLLYRVPRRARTD